MGNVRRRQAAEVLRARERADRRRTRLVVAGAIVVGLAVLAYPAVRLIGEARLRGTAVAELGVSAAAASCDGVIDDAASGTGVHRPEGTAIEYAESPPSNGEHYPVWAPFGKRFYSVEDRPAIPHLVHNLEHGYTVLWYRDTLPDDQIDLIERMSEAKLPEVTDGFFIAAPFRETDGAAWPEGEQVAFSHWSKGSTAHRQFCGAVSGEALQDFLEKYPAADAQEPGLR